MKFVLFYHSLISDWNHGNAHFLRGIATELLQRGHRVEVYEPTDGWSLQNLRAERLPGSLMGFFEAYPQLLSRFYNVDDIDIGAVLADADVVIVHEWNDPALVKKIGRHRARSGHYVLLFHDTHHRAVTDPESIARYDLEHYDGVLAFGKVLRDIYLDRGWASRAWTWHEAADTRVFRPMPREPEEGDLIWIGNWGDDERTRELKEFLIDPVKTLKLRTRIYGVRYPARALDVLSDAGIEYGGWLPNYEVPRMFARFKVTVHIPRRPYRRALPGIPTIRPFEALACGIPLVSAPWDDVEGLFTPGRDFLVARTRHEMEEAVAAVLHDRKFAQSLAAQGRATILRRHTCAHRIDELLDICRELRLSRSAEHKSRKEPAVT
ncbi:MULTISPECIES: CgeB family protein [Methylocaldum]|jgi:spore maturation protein CgeB|uniref:CgeB family protein n=1 Tax=unclassified Methylocaldum TaxID=2622260 RepID=UPI000989C7AF|nr:glycosyltransferase [Methylocaldum sp. 14B]